MMTDAELKRCLNDYECESLPQMLREVAANSRHCTSEAGGRIPTWPLHEAAERLEAIAAMSPQEDGLAELRALSAEAAPGMWKAEQWGDGSSHADSLNVVAPDSEVVLATDIFKGDAAFIVACVNYVRAELERTGGV